MDQRWYLVGVLAAALAVGSHYWVPLVGPPDFRVNNGGTRMRAAVFTSLVTDGKPLSSVLRVQTVDQPFGLDHEVLIKVRYAAINHGDWQKVTGVYPPGHCSPSAKSVCSLGLEGTVGNLQPGCEGDFIVLNPRAMPLLARKVAHASNLDELLFAMIVLGDDRIVERVTIAAGAKQE